MDEHDVRTVFVEKVYTQWSNFDKGLHEDFWDAYRKALMRWPVAALYAAVQAIKMRSKQRPAPEAIFYECKHIAEDGGHAGKGADHMGQCEYEATIPDEAWHLISGIQGGRFDRVVHSLSQQIYQAYAVRYTATHPSQPRLDLVNDQEEHVMVLPEQMDQYAGLDSDRYVARRAAFAAAVKAEREIEATAQRERLARSAADAALAEKLRAARKTKPLPAPIGQAIADLDDIDAALGTSPEHPTHYDDDNFVPWE